MAQPSYGGTAITMFFAGDDAQAKRVAAHLAQEGHGTGIAYKLIHR
jgi:hypothetical protein